MSTDDKYSRRNMLNFTKQLEAQLSQKQKTFSGFFIEFLESVLNLEHLEKKDEYSVLVISNIIDSDWFLKRLKGLVSEHHSVVNVLPGSKHC